MDDFELNILSLLNNNDINRVIILCEQHLKINPNSSNILHLLSIAFSKNSDHLKAISTISSAILIDCTNPKYYVNLGIYYKNIQ